MDLKATFCPSQCPEKPWRIVKCVPPTRTTNAIPPRNRKTFPYDTRQLAKEILANIENPATNLSSSFIKNTLQQFLPPHAQLSDTLVLNVKRTAYTMKLGKPEENTKLIPALAELLRQRGHSCEYEVIDRERMESIARQKERVRRKRLERMYKRELSTDEKLVHDIRENADNILGLDPGAQFVSFLAFAPALTAVERIPPVFFSDACHMRDTGYLFSMWGLGANKESIMLGAAFNLYPKSEVSWTQFFQFIKRHFGSIDQRGTTVIMDADKGEAAGFSYAFNEAYPFLCPRHRKSNFPQNFGGAGHKLKRLYDSVVSSCTADDYSEAAGKMQAQVPAN
eukprot:gb/GECG01001492.1/.p1 GENE.gb/GECG01001492.1/~~gb/GECG01001492.1/.p1  ORF type:complete len:338 (+),score=36.67 gb/GECG01001492.1/:1-1014(+)